MNLPMKVNESCLSTVMRQWKMKSMGRICRRRRILTKDEYERETAVSVNTRVCSLTNDWIIWSKISLSSSRNRININRWEDLVLTNSFDAKFKSRWQLGWCLHVKKTCILNQIFFFDDVILSLSVDLSLKNIARSDFSSKYCSIITVTSKSTYLKELLFLLQSNPTRSK